MPQDTKYSSYVMFVGSYADPAGPGVYSFTLDAATGAMTLIDSVSGLKNPSFLDLDHEGNKLYAIEETTTEEGGRGGSVVAFAVDPQGRLQRLNEQKSVNGSTCHIQFNAQGRYVTVASYSGGMIGMLPVEEDGKLGAASDVHVNEGTLGPRTDRQDRPHPHSTYTDPDQRYLYSPDLGLDRIKIYEPDTAAMKLIPRGEVAADPGAGPRHMAFHTSKPWVYVINELNSTIAVYIRDAANGRLEQIQSISTLPESFQGENTTAEVLLSPDGRFVYGSNRGHDSIAVFAVDEASGKLTLVEIVPSGGRIPRNFGITPDGRFLVVAHQETGNLVSFRIDAATGRLQDTGQRAEASKGVCVRFWKKPASVG
ncbi:lactonase family protein [Paenibacillus sp. P26]|nr:lactonase family protein [Paenibacillus sp. P26]